MPAAVLTLLDLMGCHNCLPPLIPTPDLVANSDHVMTRENDYDQALPVVAAAHTWNSLPQHVTSTPSMSVFQGRLKAFLFRHSFP